MKPGGLHSIGAGARKFTVRIHANGSEASPCVKHSQTKRLNSQYETNHNNMYTVTDHAVTRRAYLDILTKGCRGDF